jgi:oxygen-independent coproporphyrinogen-3 oxidase
MFSSIDTKCSALAVPDVVEKSYGLYPGLAWFSSDYSVEDYCNWIEQSNGDPLPAPLALYIQDSCGGDSPPVRGADISSSRRLNAIECELTLQGALFDSDRPVQQLICSGSISTDWTDDQLYRLVAVVQESFSVNQSGIANWCACVGIVIPSLARLRLLRILGFSSVRFAFSDHADAGNALDELGVAIKQARQLGIQQIVVDLSFHERHVLTPIQTMERFLAEQCPDRVRLVGAHDNRYQSLTRILSSIGYQNIGLDWFLRRDDFLLQAKAAGLLQWSMLGFTIMPNPDVIGIGPGALSAVGDFYAANESHWETYQALLNQQKIPVVRGIELEADDVLRREIMGMILAASCIRVTAIEEKWGIQFKKFFAYETERLHDFEQINWLEWQADSIRIGVQGYHELTELCRLFDHRAREQLSQPTLSSV